MISMKATSVPILENAFKRLQQLCCRKEGKAGVMFHAKGEKKARRDGERRRNSQHAITLFLITVQRRPEASTSTQRLCNVCSASVLHTKGLRSKKSRHAALSVSYGRQRPPNTSVTQLGDVEMRVQCLKQFLSKTFLQLQALVT